MFVSPPTSAAPSRTSPFSMTAPASWPSARRCRPESTGRGHRCRRREGRQRLRLGRAVPPRVDHRHQHHPGAHGRQDRAPDHRRFPGHLRDRPHQSAGCLQSLLPQARAAGRARAAVRGQGARARRRRGRHAARRGGDRAPGPRPGGARRGGDRYPVSQLLCPARSRGARQGDPGA